MLADIEIFVKERLNEFNESNLSLRRNQLAIQNLKDSVLDAVHDIIVGIHDLELLYAKLRQEESDGQ